jgi:hypothetical protein
VRSSLEKNPTQKRAGGMDQVVRVWGPEFKFQCSKKKKSLEFKILTTVPNSFPKMLVCVLF